MASLWIRSGYDMKVEVSAETYQVGAHFKALNEAVLMALAKILENLFPFRVSQLLCETEGILCSLLGIQFGWQSHCRGV